MPGFVVIALLVLLGVACLVVFGAGRNRFAGDQAWADDWFHVPFAAAVRVRTVRRTAWGRPRRR